MELQSKRRRISRVLRKSKNRRSKRSWLLNRKRKICSLTWKGYKTKCMISIRKKKNWVKKWRKQKPKKKNWLKKEMILRQKIIHLKRRYRKIKKTWSRREFSMIIISPRNKIWKIILICKEICKLRINLMRWKTKMSIAEKNEIDDLNFIEYLYYDK